MNEFVALVKDNLLISQKLLTIEDTPLNKEGDGDVFKGKWMPVGGCEMDIIIKKLKFEKLDSQVIRKFAADINSMHLLQHKALIKLHGVSVVGDPPKEVWLISDYAEAGSLRALLDDPQKFEALTEARKLEISYECAEGLEMLHSAGTGNLVHRELQPSRFLSCKGRFQLNGFGQASDIKKYQKNATVQNNIRWLAPEVLSNNPSWTQKADVYSFGLILWAIQTGEIPLKDQIADDAKVSEAVLRAAQQQPTIPKTCPPQLRDLIAHCWTANAAGRPSAKDILDRIRNAFPDFETYRNKRPNATKTLDRSFFEIDMETLRSTVGEKFVTVYTNPPRFPSDKDTPPAVPKSVAVVRIDRPPAGTQQHALISQSYAQQVFSQVDQYFQRFYGSGENGQATLTRVEVIINEELEKRFKELEKKLAVAKTKLPPGIAKLAKLAGLANLSSLSKLGELANLPQVAPTLKWDSLYYELQKYLALCSLESYASFATQFSSFASLEDLKNLSNVGEPVAGEDASLAELRTSIANELKHLANLKDLGELSKLSQLGELAKVLREAITQLDERKPKENSVVELEPTLLARLTEMAKLSELASLEKYSRMSKLSELLTLSELSKLDIQQKVSITGLSGSENLVRSPSNAITAWHAANGRFFESICWYGLLNLSTRDPGFYGRGIYLTQAPGYGEYYAEMIKKGIADGSQEISLLLCWTLLGNTYPITKVVYGGDKMEGYESHYASVIQKACTDDICANDNAKEKLKDEIKLKKRKFYPVSLQEKPTADEIVLFDSAQVLPRFRLTYVVKKPEVVQTTFVNNLATPITVTPSVGNAREIRPNGKLSLETLPSVKFTAVADGKPLLIGSETADAKKDGTYYFKDHTFPDSKIGGHDESSKSFADIMSTFSTARV